MDQLYLEEPRVRSSPIKRKGFRGTSSMTPTQLARKRANDRASQRAARARNKERIERLERELEGLRGPQGMDKTIQDLLRRNRALDNELLQLKISSFKTSTASSYSAISEASITTTSPVGIGNPNNLAFQRRQPVTAQPQVNDGCGAMPSNRASSRLQPSGPASITDYTQVDQQNLLMYNCEAWTSHFPSGVPSPPCLANEEQYSATAYNPFMLPIYRVGATTINLTNGNDNRIESEDFYDIKSGQSYLQQAHRQQNPVWNRCPDMNCDSKQDTACISRPCQLNGTHGKLWDASELPFDA